MKKLIVVFFILLLAPVRSQDEMTIVAIGEAKLKKVKIAIAPPLFISNLNKQKSKVMAELYELLKNDFSFYRHKLQLFEYDKKEGGEPFNTAKYDYWKLKDYSYVISFRVTDSKSDKFNISTKMYNVGSNEIESEREFTISTKEVREIGHQVSDFLYQGVFGKESIFKTQIVFVSDEATKNRKINQIKELYIMDFDGYNVKRLTYHKGNVISPAISPDKSKIVYSLVQNFKVKKKRNVDLRILDLKTLNSQVLSDKSGLNTGASFTADGGSILLTLSLGGNADIYKMNLSSKKLSRLTSHYSDDVDPSLSSDGKLMSFLSGRSGRAHIYTADASGLEKNVQRISYVGRFNATPRFSPDSKEIVFSSWVDNRFDLYRIGSNGRGLVRLTKNFGSNEEPMFSKDNEFIIFTSQRVLSAQKAIQDVYIMNREGEILGQITKDFGNCSAPRWSN